MADLFVISEAQGEKNKHAIFFHGLGGHPFDTWQSSIEPKACWLQWLAEDIEGLAVWSVGYKASVSRWRGSAMHLTDRATNVLERILLEPKLKNGELVLIGHSFGGLVIKQILRTADSLAHQRVEVAKFLKRVRRVAFLASPHSGSSLATWGDKLRVFIRPSAVTACLVRNDPYLRDLNHWYREWSAKHSIAHLILTESRPILIAGFVVKQDSSDPGLSSRPICIDADHFSICKPKDRASEIYLIVKNFISKLIETGIYEETIQGTLAAQGAKLEALFNKMDALQGTPPARKYPKELVNAEIEKYLSTMRRGRFFRGFSVSDYALRLAEKIQNGEFEGGSDDLKSSALAWCARFLAIGENGAKSDELLSLAIKLGNVPETTIAEAFRIAANGDHEEALTKLAALDSPKARSAAFIIITNHIDATSAIEWLSKSGINHSDLDPDGKFFLIAKQLELCHWDKALEYVDSIQKEDYEHTPPLLHVSAMANMVQAIPEDLKSFAQHQVPFEASIFPLASNEKALEFRRKAQELFHRCALEAEELGCVDAANIADDYALWLELRDPTDHESGLQKLQASMRDSAHSLRRLHLALQFGLKIDLRAVEREIEAQASLSGGKSHVAAIARFALAFTQESPKAVAAYIDRHRTQLHEHFEKKSVKIIEIEMLARAGLPRQAEECLKGLANDGLTDTENTFLRRIIDESTGCDPVESRKALFESSRKLNDLINLVVLLEEQKDWPQVCHYGSLLFKKTLALSDAERLALALNETNQFSELTALLRKFPEFLNQSDNLQMLWSWALFREGLLSESAAALKQLQTKRDHPSDRALTVNLAIVSGDWDSLLSYVEKEWANREQREAEDLIRTAKLAQVAGSPRAKELTYVAASKGSQNVGILVAAYFLATRAGWENEEIVARWLHEATELSDDSGPIQKMSMKDLLDRAPEWDRHETDTWQQLNLGTIPIFGAAHLLNRSLIDMFLLPALANLSEPDPRRRPLIPAYSGVRQLLLCNFRVVAMDATVLLTLGFLGLLEIAFNAFERIIIPHSTLGWLFEEKQKVSFHQPSKIINASRIRHLLAVGALKEFTGSAEIDTDLIAEVGEELASFIAEAQASASAHKRQSLVIRSYPVHRIGSLMEEEADLSPFYSYLSSCLAVVDKLKQKGQLTATEERRARSYLSLNEKVWPCQPEISDNAVLYLDDLSVTYLQHAGVLEKLRPAGLEVYVSTREKKGIDALLGYEQLTSEVSRIIESIRSLLAAGIKTKKLKVAQMPQLDISDETATLKRHPTFEIFYLAEDVEGVIVDDRFINQHCHFGTTHTPVLTSNDLIEGFHSMGHITFEQKLDYRTTLRRAAYLFVPMTKDELEHYLPLAGAVDGQLVETAELKAIRENLLRIRMSRFLQLPKEAPWLSSSMQTLSHILKLQWRPEIEESTSRARSEWLLKLLDIRGWAHCLDRDGGMTIVEQGHNAQILALFLTPFNYDSKVKEKYWEWIEECVLTKIREENPDIYSWLINRVKELISHAVDTTITEELNSGF